MPFTEYVDGEEVNEAKMYQRFFKPISDRLTAIGSDSGWVNMPSFANSWVYFGAGFPTARYRQIGAKIVLQGLIKSGTLNTNVFASPLPSGLWPSGQRIFRCAAGGTNGWARVDVLTNGNIQVVSYGATGTNSYVSLNQVAWQV